MVCLFLRSLLALHVQGASFIFHLRNFQGEEPAGARRGCCWEKLLATGCCRPSCTADRGRWGSCAHRRPQVPGKLPVRQEPDLGPCICLRFRSLPSEASQFPKLARKTRNKTPFFLQCLSCTLCWQGLTSCQLAKETFQGPRQIQFLV